MLELDLILVGLLCNRLYRLSTKRFTLRAYSQQEQFDTSHGLVPGSTLMVFLEAVSFFFLCSSFLVGNLRKVNADELRRLGLGVLDIFR